jgi:hypothetical protein
MILRRVLFLSILASAIPGPRARADDCPSIKGKIGVLFGGDGSRTAPMQPCYPDFVAESRDDGARMIDCFAREIDEMEKGTQKFIVAGHSTGAVHAEHLAQKVRDKSKIRLVLLEGYGSPLNQRGVETQCWYSKNASGEGFNAPSMKNPEVCPGGAKSSEAPWCKTSVCLHCSLVNLHDPADLGRGNLGQTFQNCKGNRIWIDGTTGQ